MRFLADENIPPDCVRQLRKANHDVISILEGGMGTPDESVMNAARQHDRILVTFDSDFGRLIYAKKKPSPPGVIFLRLGSSSFALSPLSLREYPGLYWT